MKRFFNVLIISLLLVSCASKQQEVVILSVNDMHSHIENMPKLAYIADSLRNLYPQLLIVSAGDNRTGNAYNDKYPEHSNLPMISLMNEIGFEVSALGNHEFDDNIDGIRYFINNTKFPVICANVDFSAYPDIKMPPYVTITKRINGKDVKIILLGMIETSNDGRPSAHIKNMKDVGFVDAKDVIKDYLYLKDSCDVFVLLSHCGMVQELDFAVKNPEFDMIIGGHSHDLANKIFENGVLYTQSKYYLKNATVTKLKVVDGKVTEKTSQIIDLTKVTKVDEKINKEVEYYYSRPEFKEIVGHAVTPFNDKEALGAFMADAQRYITKTDISMQNPGGVRFDNMHGGDISKADIFNLDPFNNSLVICEMTGKQVEKFLEVASTKDGFPTHVSGLKYTMVYVKKQDGSGYFKDVKAIVDDKPIDQEKVYSVALNSYMASTWAKDYCISMRDCGLTANEGEFLYLEDHKDVDYQNVRRYECNIIQE
ncbi:MAG: bifunctional metallophosphatase/5'-nucleotidase [Bacteroidales bacterium]|nr:bifunctional metallophosphatase/5'-nucleotidase [Bacteroidales bacterium]